MRTDQQWGIPVLQSRLSPTVLERYRGDQIEFIPSPDPVEQAGATFLRELPAPLSAGRVGEVAGGPLGPRAVLATQVCLQ